MSEFGITLTGDRAATLRFEQFPTFAHDRLFAALTSIEQRLEAAVIAAEPEKSGALRSMTGGRVYDHGDRMAAVVGVRALTQDAAKKASALEYGSHKSLTVRAHKAKLDHIWSRAIAEISVDVGQHTRVTNITAQDFLRGPIDSMRADALAELLAAMQLAVQDGNA